jgi:hypothetical protein
MPRDILLKGLSNEFSGQRISVSGTRVASVDALCASVRHMVLMDSFVFHVLALP